MSEHDHTQEQGWLRSHWMPLVVGGCAVVAALALTLSGIAIARQAQADTIRTADRNAATKATNTSTVATCFQKNQSAPGSIRLLRAVDIGFRNTIVSTNNAIRLQPESPLTKRRKASLKTLRDAHELVISYIKKTQREAPTQKSCVALAARLHIDPKPYLPKPK